MTLAAVDDHIFPCTGVEVEAAADCKGVCFGTAVTCAVTTTGKCARMLGVHHA